MQSLGRTKALAWLGPIVVLAGVGCDRPNLGERILQLAGPDAVDCGHVSEKDWRTVQPCLVKAFSVKQPFYVRFNIKGIDSHLERVYIGTSDARYFELFYDSDIRGSDSWLFAQPRLEERPCKARVGYPLHESEANFSCEPIALPNDGAA